MNRPSPRRVFLLTLVSTAAVGTLAHAQAVVDEKDAQAAALAVGRRSSCRR